MNYLDLFSGIGGFALGAYWAGWRFDRHYFSEIDPWCCKLYQKRFHDAVPLGDICKIDGRALMEDAEERGMEGVGVRIQRSRLERRTWDKPDAHWAGSSWIITGGFPCQDISFAGKGAGITGERSGLWFEYARLIGEIRPRYAIMENVGALTRRGLDRVLGSLAEIGYDAEWSDIRASDVGAPHRRERIWIVAYPSSNGRGATLGEQLAGKKYSESGQCCEVLADPESARRETERVTGGDEEGEGRPRGIRPSMANSSSGGQQGSRESIDSGDTAQDGEGETDQSFHERIARQWSTEPDMGRLAHGVPARVDRLKGLGNAIVPQIAEMIFRQLEDA